MTESIKTLEIKGDEVEAKGSFLFARRAKEYAVKDKDGNETPGLNAIYLGLLQRKTDSLLEFWDCATAHQTKFKKTHIEQALAEVIEEKDDTIELIRGAIETLEDSGFFKQEINTFWDNVNMSHQTVKGEEKKEEAKQSAETMKSLRRRIMEPEAETA